MLTEAVKCSLIMVVFDLLRIQAGKVWLEDFIDFASVQSVLYSGHPGGAWEQIKILVRHAPGARVG